MFETKANKILMGRIQSVEVLVAGKCNVGVAQLALHQSSITLQDLHFCIMMVTITSLVC